MKYLLIAAGVLALGVSSASAEEWNKSRYPYAHEHHERCQAAGRRLHEIEREIAMHEGRRRELREEMGRAVRELDRDCGGWRMH